MDGNQASVEPMIETDGVESEPAEALADDRAPDTPTGTGDSSAPEPTEPTESATEIVPMRVVEAILFAADSPMTTSKIASILAVGDGRDVRRHIKELNEQYASCGNSFRIEQVAGGFQMMTLPDFNTWLARLLRTRQESKLSPAAMETLAIVAYKQPCTRADIEAVRGVAVGDMVNRLREMNLVKIVGRAEDLGRPMLYGTTKRFLEVFGLPSLDDLPQVEALSSGNTESSTGSVDPTAESVEAAGETTEGATDAAAAGEGAIRIADPAETEDEAADSEGVGESSVEDRREQPEAGPDSEDADDS